MGFGGLFKQQDALTQESNSLAMQSGQARQQAAYDEAGAQRKQADLAYQEIQTQKILEQRDIDLFASNQEYSYISGGVQAGMGTPLAVVNETRKLGQMRLDAMEARGRAIKDLGYSQAGILERGGRADYQTAVGSTRVNTMQNKLSQKTARSNFYQGLFGQAVGGAWSGGLSILRALV